MDKNELFAKYEGQKIAIYGLGAETKTVLDNLSGSYEIVGLLDSFREDGELYGKQILSFIDAIRLGIKLIIVVARPGSCRAISKKIGSQCQKNSVGLMDVRGRDLLENPRVSYNLLGIEGITKSELKEKMRSADIISFDLFETLVMRQTVSSDDVLDLVSCKLAEKYGSIKDFYKRRLESEKELSRSMVPTLTEIYKYMLNKMDYGKDINVSADMLAELEWNIDFSLLVPRNEVCDIFRETVKSGKRVYIVSDTYYSKKQLVLILEKIGIEGYIDVLASCEYKTDKRRNLFKILKNLSKDSKYLHIGDDFVADVECAERWGIEACRLQSGMELLESIGNLGLSYCINSLSDRLKMGIFVSKVFNSPFQFENKDRYMGINDSYDIGYLLCAPVICDFVMWLYEHVERERFANIWFGARDGYLIKKMYAHLMKTVNKTDETVYFLTSRIAAIRAGIQDESDIRYVDEMKFSGTLEENLRERFGIDFTLILDKHILSNESGLMKFKYSILENAHREHKNYRKYIEKLDIKKENIAFVDFVAKGTTQMYIQKLIDNPLKGFYFLHLEPDIMKKKGLDVCSLYEMGHSSSEAMFDEYYILETILTAPHPSVVSFEEDGEPIYALETRKDKDIHCFERAQEGIQDYFKLYLDICPKSERCINKEMDGIMLKLIHRFKILDKDFLEMVVEDPFFNRMTNMRDIL